LIGLDRAARIILSWPIDQLDALRASYWLQVHRILWRIGIKAMMRGKLARSRDRQEAIERFRQAMGRYLG
jgi:hypothetical protein